MDTIIALWFDLEGSEIKRMLTVLKQRGSRHSREKREMDFERGG